MEYQTLALQLEFSFLTEALIETLLQTPLELMERLQLASKNSGGNPDQALRSLQRSGLKAIVYREERMLIRDALTQYCGVWAHTVAITSRPESLCL